MSLRKTIVIGFETEIQFALEVANITGSEVRLCFWL